MQTQIISRRHFIASMVGTATLATVGAPQARAAQLMQSRIVVGFPPGGMPDIIARRVAEALVERFAKSMVVDNRTGAGGQLAVLQTKTSPADGSTLLFTPASMLTIYPHTYKKLPYDPVADLAPVALVGHAIPALAVGPQVPASVTDARSYVQWAKANPSLASYGSPAAGSSLHFAGLMLAKEAGVDLQHVPYRGTQPALLDLLGGRIPAIISTQGEFFTHKKAGTLRILAVASAKRSSAMPEVPTFAEQGYPSVIASDFQAFFLPAGSSRELIKKASADLRVALATQAVKNALQDTGIEPATSTPEELGALLRSELARWAPVVRQSGFTADA